MITVMRSFLLITLTGPVQCTVNSRYSRHCRDLESVSLLVRVRNTGVYFSQMSIIIYFCLGFRCCPFYWDVHYSGMFTRQELTYMQVIARRGVTSCYHSSKFLNLNSLCWQTWLFAWLFALLKDGRKVWATILFLGAIMHRKVLSIFSFSLFSLLQYLQDHGLLRSRNFVTMVTWCNDFSSLLHIGVHTRVWMCSGECMSEGVRMYYSLIKHIF